MAQTIAWFMLTFCLCCTWAKQLGPITNDPGSDFLSELIKPTPVSVKAEETDTTTMGVLYNEVPMSNLVRSCFKQIPLTYREKCLFQSFERFTGSVFPLKTRCCTKWHQIDCLEQYAFNSIYCDMHQRLAISRYFNQIKSTGADGSPECAVYRPIKEEQELWSSSLGRVAKCATSSKEPMMFESHV